MLLMSTCSILFPAADNQIWFSDGGSGRTLVGVLVYVCIFRSAARTSVPIANSFCLNATQVAMTIRCS